VAHPKKSVHSGSEVVREEGEAAHRCIGGCIARRRRMGALRILPRAAPWTSKGWVDKLAELAGDERHAERLPICIN